MKILRAGLNIPAIILIIISFFSSYPCLSQPYFDPLQLYCYKSPLFRKSDYTDKSYSESYSAKLAAPISVSKHKLLTAAGYEQYTYQAKELQGKQTVSSIELPLTFIYQHKKPEKKSIIVFVQRLNGDFDNYGFADFYQAGGAYLYSIKKSSSLTLKFGMYYNSEFFGPFFMPLAGIEWKMKPRMIIHGTLPNNLTLEYKLSPVFCTGLSFRTYTSSYRLNNPGFLKLQDNHLKLFGDFYLSKNLVFSLEAGHSILRKYRTGIRSDGKNEYNKLDLPDNALFRLALIYRFRLDDQ